MRSFIDYHLMRIMPEIAPLKGDQPAGVDDQADAMEDAVDRFGLVGQGGDECQQKMEGHPGQRGDAGDVVPFGGLAVGLGEQVHLVGPQIVAQEADAKNDQVLPMQPCLRLLNTAQV